MQKAGGKQPRKTNKGSQTTVKKTKVLGTQEYINASTGELVAMQVTSVEERDFNFSKVWMRSFLATLDLVGNAKTKVAYWIIDHIDRMNQLTYTYRQMADETGMSLDTVTATMKALLEADFLRRKNQGCYIVNPNVIYKGTHNARLNVLTQYGDLEREKSAPPTPEEQLQNLLETIKRLTDKATQLQEEIKKSKDTSLPGQTTIDDLELPPEGEPPEEWEEPEEDT